MLLAYWIDTMMRRPDPGHTLGNECKAVIDTFTGAPGNAATAGAGSMLYVRMPLYSPGNS